MGKKNTWQNSFVWMLIFVLVSLVTLGGCASPLKESKIEVDTSPCAPSVKVEEKEYVLRPGDVISVTFFYFPRLDATLKIRPDGYISIAPVDDVKAAGLTPRELDKILTQLYAERIENPELTVAVKEFAAQKVYVGGEVRNGDIYDLEVNMTALEAIFKAGGPLKTGSLKSVIIIRKKKDGTPRVFSVNLAPEIKSKKVINDVYLRPLDVVFVPKTFIAKIDQFVEQYIEELIPITLTAGFSYVTGSWRPR